MNTEKQYTQAFNNGYLIAKYESALFYLISKNLSPTNNYMEGFFAGKDQVELNKEVDKLIELEQLRSTSISREDDLGQR